MHNSCNYQPYKLFTLNWTYNVLSFLCLSCHIMKKRFKIGLFTIVIQCYNPIYNKITFAWYDAIKIIKHKDIICTN